MPDTQPSESQPQQQQKPQQPSPSADSGSSAPEQIKDREAPTSDSYGNTRDSGEKPKKDQP